MTIVMSSTRIMASRINTQEMMGARFNFQQILLEFHQINTHKIMLVIAVLFAVHFFSSNTLYLNSAFNNSIFKNLALNFK